MGEQKDNSLSRRVFRRLREDILSGRYKEHDELREVALANELGVSRTPVREALRQLELEGLVSSVANKGAFVAGFSSKDVRDIFAVRSLLDGLCVRWATENITQGQLDRLEEVMLISEYHMKKEEGISAAQMASLEREFYKILYEASGSRILSRILTGLQHYVRQAVQAAAFSEEWARKSIRELRQILHAVKDRDADTAEQLAEEHILHVIQNSEERGFDKI